MKHYLVWQNKCEKYGQGGYPHFFVVQQRVTIIVYILEKSETFSSGKF